MSGVTFLQPDRRPGEFLRTEAGAPRVADPDGAITKSGPRKGLPLLRTYSRMSSLSNHIGRKDSLRLWSQRQALIGAVRLNLGSQVDEALALDDEDEQKARLNELVAQCEVAAKSALSADRGTHTHRITELHDGDGAHWLTEAERGEQLDMPTEVQRILVATWQAMLDRYGLEVIGAEETVVNDEHRAAGTLDRRVRATRDVRIGRHSIRNGDVLVLDIKTGKLHRDKRTGEIVWRYFSDHAIQIYGYASSVPYDPDTDTRGQWAEPPRTDLGLIAHLDVKAALAGATDIGRLIAVDLEAGQRAMQLVAGVREWEKADDVIEADDPIQIAPDAAATPRPASVEPPPPDSHGNASGGGTIYASTNPDAMHVQAEALRKRIELLADPERKALGEAWKAAGLPKVAALTAEQHADATALVDQFDPFASTAVPAAAGAAAPRPPSPAAALPQQPDEGAAVGDGDPEQQKAAVEALGKRYMALPNEVREWIANLEQQARHRAVPFRVKDNPTVRRFEIVRGLCILGEQTVDEALDTEALRALVALAMQSDVPLFANVAPGHALGALNAAEAAAFALHCQAFADGQLAGHIDNDGRLRLSAAA